MSSKQEALEAYNEWSETYKPGVFVEYSEEEYERLTEEVDKHLVWTHHGTCETERYTNGVHNFNSGCGCWQVFGWTICEVPWVGDDDTYLSTETEWAGPCETCNVDGEDEHINQECPECDGEGYVQEYFD